MRRAAAMLLLTACAWTALGCGKYGPPVRADQKDQPAGAEAQSEEAKP